MKLTLSALILLSYFTSGTVELPFNCNSDKGIKTSITTGVIEFNDNSKKDSKIEAQEIEFNKNGQPTLIKETKKGGATHKRVYKNGKLDLIITSRKKLPDFYQSKHLDSLISNAPLQIDTAKILSHHKNGRAAKMLDYSGTTWIFEYFGCNKEITTTLNTQGDTIQQVLVINKNGAPIERTWIPFAPVKSYITTKYLKYKFNKKGHWIKRKYKISKGVITEKRKLTYY